MSTSPLPVNVRYAFLRMMFGEGKDYDRIWVSLSEELQADIRTFGLKWNPQTPRDKVYRPRPPALGPDSDDNGMGSDKALVAELKARGVI